MSLSGWVGCTLGFYGPDREFGDGYPLNVNFSGDVHVFIFGVFVLKMEVKSVAYCAVERKISTRLLISLQQTQ